MKKQSEIIYPFDTNIMFAKVMGNPQVCREFIQRLFTDREVKDIKDVQVSTVTTEATLIPGINAKSVRMDVLFSDDKAWYNIEMQVAKEGDLPMRGRYYSAAMDVAHLKKGQIYGDMKQSFVIFICRFDYYGQNKAVYTFERFDRKNQLICGDGTYIIMLNTECPEEKVPEELQSFFHYINTTEVETGDWFIEKIHDLVIGYQSDEEVAYMATLEEEYLRKSILAERKGRAEEREMLNKLNALLAKQGRIEELVRAAEDAELQQKLLEELGLV